MTEVAAGLRLLAVVGARAVDAELERAAVAAGLALASPLLLVARAVGARAATRYDLETALRRLEVASESDRELFRLAARWGIQA